MTPNESTPAREKESTDQEPHLFDRENAHGFVSGEAFFEPETAAVDISVHGDELVTVQLREATNSRGLKTTWFVPVAEAREVVDELAEAIDEIEDGED